MPEVNRWRYEVVDYQNNVMAQVLPWPPPRPLRT